MYTVYAKFIPIIKKKNIRKSQKFFELIKKNWGEFGIGIIISKIPEDKIQLLFFTETNWKDKKWRKNEERSLGEVDINETLKKFLVMRQLNLLKSKKQNVTRVLM